MKQKTALVTGGARRIGAEIVRELHAGGFCVVIHYHRSAQDALDLAHELNQIRADSACAIQADLLETSKLKTMVEQVAGFWGGLSVLINNASCFYPTPIESTTEAQWDEIMGCHLKAPFFLAQAAAPFLSESRGSIVNIVDIYAERGLKDYPIYSISKAGLIAMTKVLAKELAPNIRVNAIAPGAILWPERDMSESEKNMIISRIALKRTGEPSDIAKAILYFVNQAPFVTGQVLAIDGGRSVVN